MEKILNIPSVISHSYFTFFGKNELLGEKEINYFFSLLYLFRENLTEETKQQIFKKVGGKNTINEDYENIAVNIKLSQLSKLGVINNYTYTNFKKFIIKLNNRRIVINTLGKDKRYDTKPMKMIEEYSFSKKYLNIKLTKEFLYLFLHTEEYFMKVDLDILFKISGKKSKRIYLIIKDYINMNNPCIKITKEKLEKMVGRLPSFNKNYKNKEDFINIFDNINTIKDKTTDTNISDVYIEYPELIQGLYDKYVFNFINLSNDEKNEDTVVLKDMEADEEYQKIKEKYDNLDIDIEGFTKQQIKEIENDTEKRFNEIKEKYKPKNKEGYFIKMLKNEFTKLKPSEYQIKLDKWIYEYKTELEFDTTSSQIPYIGVIVGKKQLYIDDDYRLTNLLDYYTDNPSDTIIEINNLLTNGGNVEVIYNDGYSKLLSKVCLLSQSELRSRGKI